MIIISHGIIPTTDGSFKCECGVAATKEQLKYSLPDTTMEQVFAKHMSAVEDSERRRNNFNANASLPEEL